MNSHLQRRGKQLVILVCLYCFTRENPHVWPPPHPVSIFSQLHSPFRMFPPEGVNYSRSHKFSLSQFYLSPFKFMLADQNSSISKIYQLVSQFCRFLSLFNCTTLSPLARRNSKVVPLFPTCSLVLLSMCFCLKERIPPRKAVLV